MAAVIWARLSMYFPLRGDAYSRGQQRSLSSSVAEGGGGARRERQVAIMQSGSLHIVSR